MNKQAESGGSDRMTVCQAARLCASRSIVVPTCGLKDPLLCWYELYRSVHGFGTQMCAGRGLPSHKYEFVLYETTKRKRASRQKSEGDGYSSKITDANDF